MHICHWFKHILLYIEYYTGIRWKLTCTGLHTHSRKFVFFMIHGFTNITNNYTVQHTACSSFSTLLLFFLFVCFFRAHCRLGFLFSASRRATQYGYSIDSLRPLRYLCVSVTLSFLSAQTSLTVLLCLCSATRVFSHAELEAVPMLFTDLFIYLLHHYV